MPHGSARSPPLFQSRDRSQNSAPCSQTREPKLRDCSFPTCAFALCLLLSSVWSLIRLIPLQDQFRVTSGGIPPLAAIRSHRFQFFIRGRALPKYVDRDNQHDDNDALKSELKHGCPQSCLSIRSPVGSTG